eukprot:CAMPEP_0170924080 /NCGR_PEP_ID=MMETSP0735-20130129/11452_1 /TAXON_ID=186038 /ORGANISM="Fragilariopsis kerguelensis, Strain L26-C5" /LENGTH=84 /DNA_ID=CAMNT_0011323855 /DNA_START=391 /DNA_END=646 /DNA_ORIENTATION=+
MTLKTIMGTEIEWASKMVITGDVGFVNGGDNDKSEGDKAITKTIRVVGCILSTMNDDDISRVVMQDDDNEEYKKKKRIVIEMMV